jgi:hypothetical protein
MRFGKYYTNDTLCRMEAIFERTCLDLGISDNSDYARSSREVLAFLMFALPPPRPGLVQLAADDLKRIAEETGSLRGSFSIASGTFPTQGARTSSRPLSGYDRLAR